MGGFVGGIWARSGNEALAWGWAGGWRRWRADESSGAGGAAEMWIEVGAVTGHAGPVRGISWAPNGEYLASTGYGFIHFAKTKGELIGHIPT